MDKYAIPLIVLLMALGAISGTYKYASYLKSRTIRPNVPEIALLLAHASASIFLIALLLGWLGSALARS